MALSPTVGRSTPSATTRKSVASRLGDGLTQLHLLRRRIAIVCAAAITLAVGYHVVFGQNGLIAYQQKRQDAKTLDGELKSLERENGQLKSHVDRLQSDPDAIEHQAREELHYTRPGEVIYTLPAAPSASTSTTPKAANEAK